MAIVIDVTGEARSVHPEQGIRFELQELQDLVGGCIEVVTTRCRTQGILMLCNKDGIEKQLKINPVGTVIARKPVLGTIVLVSPEEFK